jgi:hypothetical protein
MLCSQLNNSFVFAKKAVRKELLQNLSVYSEVKINVLTAYDVQPEYNVFTFHFTRIKFKL